MACTSGSVQSVADRTVAAKDQIDRLQSLIEAQKGDIEAKFEQEISSFLSKAQVMDARAIDGNSDAKTEYSSEFSLDKIAAVVTSALRAVAAAKDPAVPDPATSPEAIAAYSDLVNTVAESAKSSSTASASLSFSATRLSPGLFVFLYATSVSIKDEDTFGTEAVTTTVVFYRIAQSIDDVQSQEEFDVTLLDATLLRRLKTLQVGLLDRLAGGEIDIDQWRKLDASFQESVDYRQARLNEHSLQSGRSLTLTAETGQRSEENQQLVRGAIQRLSAMGEAYEVAVEVSEARLSSAYF